ncbi:hypothetical protein FQA39_LY16461 [Lamprigera yunnana]|nr:hypothetical protein FQA39_LY16461 [Lamprigera yunnana]
MSWPPWPATNVPQTGLIQSSLINPAPVVNPPAQYTPEQWSQMQHQNWQQWAQWQQQFQQWQQQYGAEYQKSIGALAQASMPVQPPVPLMGAPPLPLEVKPPPPPEEPTSQPQSTVTHSMSVPPPVTQPTYNTVPAQLAASNPSVDNKLPPSRNVPPPTTTNFSSFDSNNQQKFPRTQSYNTRGAPGSNANWSQQNNNRNQPTFNRFTQPPPMRNENENRFEQGTKRVHQHNEYDSCKRNKLDNINKQELNVPNKWPEVQPKKSLEWGSGTPLTISKTNNPEELSEAEKKFDKQFNDWEAQFQKWKQQNANHPDKEQYREYEKKWETWRSQLLERREQMKRKRLGTCNNSPRLTGDKPLQNKVESQQSQVVSQSGNQLAASSVILSQTNKNQANVDFPQSTETGLKSGSAGFSRPPPNLNDQPLEFKKSTETFTMEIPLETKEASSKLEVQQSDFLKSTSSGGIPGLDLVKDSGETAKSVDDQEHHVDNENSRPDLEVISRGINSILGDQKLLNILSLVSQHQNRPFANNSQSKVESPKFSPTEYNQGEEYDEYEESTETSKFDKLDDTALNAYDQSSMNDTDNKFDFDQGEENYNEDRRPFDNFQRNDRNFGQSGNDYRDYGKNNPNKRPINLMDGYNERYCGDMRKDNVNTFKKDVPIFDRNFGNLNKDSANFNENFQKPPINFERGNVNFGQDVDNFERYRGTTNKQFDGFNKNSNFNRGSDNFMKPFDNFKKGFEHSTREFDNFGGHRGIDNFNRHTDNINRGPSNFSRGIQSTNFDLSQNKGKGLHHFPEAVSTGNDDFSNLRRSFPNRDNFGRGSDNFNHNINKSVLNKAAFEFPNERSFIQKDSEPSLQGKECNRTFNKIQTPEKDSDGYKPTVEFNRPLGTNQRNIIPDHFNRKLPSLQGNFNTTLNNQVQSRQSQDCEKTLDTFNFPPRPNSFTNSADLNKGVFGKNTDQNNSMEKKEVNRIIQEDKSAHDISPDFKQPNIPSTEGIWKTNNVIDYDHKSSTTVELDIILEPFHRFDYRHKPLNRIPFPSRPKWLSEMINNYPEFDVTSSRRSMEYRGYPANERIDTYFKYDNRGRKLYDDRNQRSLERDDRNQRSLERDDRNQRSLERDKYVDRDRIHYEERGHRQNDDKEKRIYDKDRSFFDDKIKPHSNKNDSAEQHSHVKKEAIFDEDFEDFEDEPDFEFLSPEKNLEDGKVNDKNKSSTTKPTTTSALQKSNVTLIEDLLSSPGRFSRPPRIVIILRGPPGSGKSFLAKLIKDQEVENGGSAPRILCLDDYFMVEQEKEIEEDGRKIKIKEMVYEYEEEMEASYRQSLMKSFKKTLTDGYFNFIIIDNINDKVKYFGEMWSNAKQNGFQVYICQMELDVQICTKRNIHDRSEAEIQRCVDGWEPTPSHHPVLDATSLIQSGSIPEVEMEEINSPSSDNFTEEREFLQERLITSKWDNFDYSVDNLAKLDGTNKPLRTSRTMEDYLQLDDEWIQPIPSKPGQKRVRWADLEERKEQEKMRAIGFVVGHTNWDRMMDPTMGGSALTQTKYFERLKTAPENRPNQPFENKANLPASSILVPLVNDVPLVSQRRRRSNTRRILIITGPGKFIRMKRTDAVTLGLLSADDMCMKLAYTPS